MKIRDWFIFSIFLLIQPIKSFCWGPDGHKNIGHVAYHYANQKTRDSLRYYLGAISVADAGLWMDEMRKNHDYDYMKPWHYIAFERGESYQPGKGENIINELNKRMEHLKHRNLYTKEQVATDLKILIHLTEDLHMPLHVGYPSDTEGNAIHISFMNKPTTLHWAWDNDIMLQQNITVDTLLALLNTFSKQELDEKRKTNILLWMNESRSYLPNVYDFKGDSIDIAYANKNASIIKVRLALAGLRLGNLLNELFHLITVRYYFLIESINYK